MDFEPLVERLRAGGESLVAALAGVGTEQAQWKPSADAWSIVEVAAHLLDEERLDFRVRIMRLLEEPQSRWPAIDPEGWVTVKDYASWDLAQTVDDFRGERRESLAWLEGCAAAAWSTTYEHPQLGALRAGDVLVSWVAHDALHLRQLARLHYGWTARLGEPYSADYAGPW